MKRLNITLIALFAMLSASCHTLTPNPRGLTDREQVLQAVIDSPNLKSRYWIKEFPYRKPLMITGPMVAPGSTLRAFGVPVIVISSSKKESLDATAQQGHFLPYYLHIRSLKIKGSIAEVDYDYPAEGQFGHVSLKKRGEWIITNECISER